MTHPCKSVPNYFSIPPFNEVTALKALDVPHDPLSLL